MSEADVVWSLIIGAGFAYEAYTLRTKRRGDTASETTRRWWMTNTKPGRYLFLAALYGTATWYAGHVLDWWP